MTTEIKIISCINSNLWYNSRVGSTHPATIVNGVALVNGNPTFKVYCMDYLVTKSNIKEPKYTFIINELELSPLTVDDLCRKILAINYMNMCKMIAYLSKRKIIIKTGKKKLGRMGYHISIWSLQNSNDDIPETVGGGYKKCKGKAT